MAQLDKNPSELKAQLKAKIDSFAVEELEARLEMAESAAWFDDINVACKDAAAAEQA